MKQNKTLIKLASSVALTGALVLGATACSNNSNESSSQSSKVSKAKKNTKKAVKQNETKLKRTKIQVSQQSALNKFNEKYPDTKIKEIDYSSRKLRSTSERLGWRNLRNAFASI